MSQRNRILVDPPVQWAITGRILMHWAMLFVCMILIGTCVRVMFSAGSIPFGEATAGALKAQAPFLVVMVILLPLFLRDSMKLSNRFAGPMYRLKTELRSIADANEPRRIKFREGDFWQDVAGDFNTLTDELKHLREQNLLLRRDLDALQTETLPSGASSDAPEAEPLETA